MRLAQLPYTDGATVQVQSTWGGVDYRCGAGNGAIAEEVNCSSALYPAVSSAPARRRTDWRDAQGHSIDVTPTGRPNGIYVRGEEPNASGYSGGHHYLVFGNQLFRNGYTASAKTLPGSATADRVIVSMGEQLIIFPDKVAVETSDAAWAAGTAVNPKPLAKAVGGNGIQFDHQREASVVVAEANSVILPVSVWEADAFAVGDAVTIHGTPWEMWDKTIIIREIDASNRALRFDEHSFDPPEGTTLPVTVDTYVSVARRVPDMDYLCEQGNRLWGCKGDTIYCSKLGDPTNWNVFDGLSTDSWAVDTGSGGSFTGCCSFLGYPCFFKADKIYKVYGTRPANFELVGGPSLGVRPGCAKSLAVCGDMLYYISRQGLTVYAGGLPRRATDFFGSKRLSDAVAGSDGRLYYLAARDRTTGIWSEWVYDTETGLLSREEAELWNDEWPDEGAAGYDKSKDRRLVGYGAYNSGILRLHRSGESTYSGEDMRGQGVDPDYCMVQTGDYDYIRYSSRSGAAFAAQYPVRLWLRYEVKATKTVTFSIRYDGGSWEQVVTYTGDGTREDHYTPVPVRRCRRYALKMEATGPFRLWDIQREIVDEAKARR